MGELIKVALHFNSNVEISSYPGEFFLCSDLIIFSFSWVDMFSNFVFGNEPLDNCVT